MPANIPGKSLRIDERRREPSRMRILIEYPQICFAYLGQPVRCSQPGRSSAENDDGLVTEFVHVF